MRVGLLVALLAVLLSALSYRALKQEKSVLAEQFAEGVNVRLRGQLDAIEAELQRAQAAIDRSLSNESDWRKVARMQPLVRQAFVLSSSGTLTFPSSNEASSDEALFLSRTSDIWAGKAVLHAPSAEDDTQRVKRGQGDSMALLASRSKDGWLTWYFDDGMQLLYWKRLEDGRIAGAWVERIALEARLVATLKTDEGRLTVSDASGEVVHEVGHGERHHEAIATLALPVPFQSWRLQYFATPAQRQAFLSPRLRTGEALAVLAVLLVIGALAVLIAREQQRALRDASQRVSFVTQVSHELKTPLTNIRLYAELLEENDRHAQVIAQESRRLSRLIDNVLSFSRPRELRLQPVELDTICKETAEQFRAGLLQRGMQLELALSAPHPVKGDADAIAQILGNLLSNAEKYATSGGHVAVATEQDATHTRLIVSDRGPGIPLNQREQVFAPYFRLSGRLTDGVTGTGIGLTIARDLAHKLGGTLEVVPSGVGACFVLKLENA